MSEYEWQSVRPMVESPHRTAHHAGWWNALCEEPECELDGFMDNKVYVGKLTGCPRCHQTSVRSSHSIAQEDGVTIHARNKDCVICGWFVRDIVRLRDGPPYQDAQAYYSPCPTAS